MPSISEIRKEVTPGLRAMLTAQSPTEPSECHCFLCWRRANNFNPGSISPLKAAWLLLFITTMLAVFNIQILVV